MKNQNQKLIIMKAVFIVLTLNLICCHYVAADHGDLCRVLADGTQFRRPDSCSEYIACSNQTGRAYSCATPSMYDRNINQCVAEASDCDVNYCAGVNGKWLANPNNCDGYFYCVNSVAHAGYCESGFHFDESKQMCIFDVSSSCVEVSNICTFLPDKTKLRDENDCTIYYECSGGKKSKKTCKNTYFDVEKGACVDKMLVACTNHPLPSNVCGTEKKPSPGYKEDGATCRGFFYCQNLGIVPDLDPGWGQCPIGTFFDTATKSCTDPINAVCKYNRCEGRGTMLVQTSSNNCRNYLVCENGIPVEERTCNNDKFFDEKYQACVNYIVSHKCCDGTKA